MKVAVFSAKSYDRSFLSDANAVAGNPHDLQWPVRDGGGDGTRDAQAFAVHR